MNKVFAVTMGEPAGIGGELTVKAWAMRKEKSLPPFFAIDNAAHLRSLSSETPIIEISKPAEALEVFDKGLPVLNIDLPETPILGMLNPANAGAVMASIKRAVSFCLGKQAAAMVTQPIHKAALYEAGFNHPGHTEFIADLCGEVTPLMMLAAQDLRVAPLTVHIPLKDVPAAVTADLITKKVRILNGALRQDFKIATPHIVLAGLNPHAGEDGKMGREEIEIIAPAIETLRRENINVTGPYPADTLFHADSRARYDAAIGMYHDQALIPLKTLDFHGGVNITLGLPIIRTSPDHGTALTIAGQGKARADSFINAILMAQEIAKNRQSSK